MATQTPQCNSEWSASGRMGAGLVRRLMRDGHRCVGYDVFPDAAQGARGRRSRRASTSFADFASKLEKPRAAWVMVPAGEITDKTIASLAEVLELGDAIIDGGNSTTTTTSVMRAAL